MNKQLTVSGGVAMFLIAFIAVFNILLRLALIAGVLVLIKVIFF